jgi:hypothetical protein
MNRFASSIFCDDIRNEINGKISMMGVVGGNLYVQEFPFVVPRLCVLVSVFTPMDQLFKHLSIRGDYEGAALFDVEMSDDEVEQLANELPDNPYQTATAAQAMFVVSPLAMEGPGRLKITITVDGEDIYCPGLSVQKAPDGMNLV